MVSVATPLASVAEPIEVPLSEKVTVPDGKFVLLPDSVAVSATLVPDIAEDGFTDSRIALKIPAAGAAQGDGLLAGLVTVGQRQSTGQRASLRRLKDDSDGAAGSARER